MLQLLSKHHHGLLQGARVPTEDGVLGEVTVGEVSSKQDMQPEIQHLNVPSLGKLLGVLAKPVLKQFLGVSRDTLNCKSVLFSNDYSCIIVCCFFSGLI